MNSGLGGGQAALFRQAGLTHADVIAEVELFGRAAGSASRLPNACWHERCALFSLYWTCGAPDAVACPAEKHFQLLMRERISKPTPPAIPAKA